MVGRIESGGESNNRDLFHKAIRFTFSGISKHIFSPGGTVKRPLIFTLGAADRANISNMLNGRPEGTAKIIYKGDQMVFSSQKTEAGFEVSLDEITHIFRSPNGLHLQHAGRLAPAFQSRFQKEGLSLEVQVRKPNEAVDPNPEWKPFEMDLMTILTKAIPFGSEMKMRVKGGNEEQRQKALIDLMLLMQFNDEFDILKTQKKPQTAKMTFTPNFASVNGGSMKTNTVRSIEGVLPHNDDNLITSFPGSVVAWKYDKSFDRVKKAFAAENKTEVDIGVLADIFRRLIDSYSLKISELKEGQDDELSKFKSMFESYEQKLVDHIEGFGGRLKIYQLEQFFSNERKQYEESENGARIEDVDLVIKYLVRGLMGEEFENTLSMADKPVILIAPSMSPIEAENLPANVLAVLSSDMCPNSHPEMLLGKKGIPLLRPEGALQDYIRTASEDVEPGKTVASVVVGQRRVWLNLGLPEELVEYFKHSRKIEEAEDMTALALNGLPREIRGGGRRILIKAIVSGEDKDVIATKYKIYKPDGIGLVRMEMRDILKGIRQTIKERTQYIVDICDIAREKVNGQTFLHKVTVRYTDVAVKGKRRDGKKLPGINNPEGRSGADFLLNEPGQKTLREDAESFIRAHLERPGQLDAMFPDVENEEQYQELLNVLDEVKQKLSEELGIPVEQMNIQHSAMFESRKAALLADKLTKHSSFMPYGLNDYRFDAGDKSTILNKEDLVILSDSIKAGKKRGKLASSCGKINNENEFIALIACGFGSVSVDFHEVPKWGVVTRSLHEQGLKRVKEKLATIASDAEIPALLKEAKGDLDGHMVTEAERMSALGYSQRRQAVRAALSEIHSTRVHVFSQILEVIADDQPEKGQRIHDILKENGNSFGDIKLEDIARFVDDKELLISFLDGWEIKKALIRECRRTPYFFRKESDGTYWGRSIPQMENTGINSRYFIEEQEVTNLPGDKDKTPHLNINYYNVAEKVTKKASCSMRPLKGSKDRFEVVVPRGNGDVKIIQVLCREENGGKVYYRKLSGEKQYIAMLLMNDAQVPAHPAINAYKSEDNAAVYISDRESLSELSNIPVDIKESYKRDAENVFYLPKGATPEDNKHNVNQSLYLKLGDMPDGRVYMIMVDTWMPNRDGEFKPLIEDPAQLIDFLKFWAAERKEAAMITKGIEANETLQRKVTDLEAQLAAIMKKAKEMNIPLV